MNFSVTVSHKHFLNICIYAPAFDFQVFEIFFLACSYRFTSDSSQSQLNKVWCRWGDHHPACIRNNSRVLMHANATSSALPGLHAQYASVMFNVRFVPLRFP